MCVHLTHLLIEKAKQPFHGSLTLTGKRSGPLNKTDEQEMAGYFNKLCSAAKMTHGFRAAKDHIFIGKFSSLPLRTLEVCITCKPDILTVKNGTILKDKNWDSKHLGWLEVACPAELKATKYATIQSFMTNVSKDICDKAFCIFESQHHRCYIVAWSMMGDIIQISILDCSTVLHTIPFNFQKEPKLFLHLILGLAFASDTAIGFNPIVVVNARNEQVVLINRKLCILKQLY